MSSAATTTPAGTAASATMCRNAPRMLRSPLRPEANSPAVAPFTTIPTLATIMTVPLATGSGCKSRRTPSQAIAPTATRSKTALNSAARIEEPPKPYVNREEGARLVSALAIQAMTSARTSERLCPASAISATELASTPHTNSAATKLRLRPMPTAKAMPKLAGACTWVRPSRFIMDLRVTVVMAVMCAHRKYMKKNMDGWRHHITSTIDRLPCVDGIQVPLSLALQTSSRRDISLGYWVAMKAARRTMTAMMCKAGRHRCWCWPLAFALAAALVVSLFHDLPALAGGGDLAPIPGAVASSTATPFQAPDAQAPGHSCHCLCHITDRCGVTPVVTPIVFTNSLNPPPDGEPICSWAGLPPFRPPRV